MASTKTLGQLSLIEHRRELRCRELKVSGNKEALMERLKQSIIDDEQDPDTYLFEIEPDTAEIWKSMKEQIKEDLKLVKDELKNELGNKLSSIESVVFGLKKDMDDYKQQLRDEVTELRSRMVEDVDSQIQVLRNEMKAGLEKKQYAGATVTEMMGKTKPPVFDGSVSWSVYRLQFEAAAKVNRWNTKAEKATVRFRIYLRFQLAVYC
ncbi:uncharacterized protein LOC129924919 [Biomphalaria glabrata]|uniref:Uncharacterized protein LOC129924919 n=1 Tax=Biomphalaria glabrata TaxID=6526 RepID=A0A9W2ZTZ1_BIOGL|nr:uncharacterized protein LOC129924919 [Biomphalaria glabrata]